MKISINMATITIYPAQTIEVDVDSLVLEKVTDSPTQQVVYATIPNLYRDIYLWRGSEEYAEAGVWTNESALQRAKDLINAGNVRFV